MSEEENKLTKNPADEATGRKVKRVKTAEEIEKEQEDKVKNLQQWTTKKIELSEEWIEKEEQQIARNLVRGGIYMCELGENIGSEQGSLRPVVVISNDLINRSSGNIFVVPLTKTLKKKIQIGADKKPVRDKDGKIIFLNEPKMQSHYFLRKQKYTFLQHDSAAMCEVSRAVSKIRISTHLGNIESTDINKIETRLEWVLGIKKSQRKR